MSLILVGTSDPDLNPDPDKGRQKFVKLSKEKN